LSVPPDLLDLSLNEVEQLAQKAARGAGLPWGVAEDTGRAAAWIASRVGPWSATLLALLEAPPAADESPLLLAGGLADGIAPRRIARVVAPLWALPGLLTTTRQPVSIGLDDVTIGCNPREDAGATVPAERLAAIPAASLSLRFDGAGALPHPLPRTFRRSLVPGEEWRRLTAFAFRTYVPASDRSRLTGAGAGLLDDE
jgi:hypothetical protein